MKRPDGVTAIAVWFFVDAIFMLFFACLLVAVPVSGVIREINDPIGEFWAVFGLTCGVIFILVGGLLSVFAGWGLLRLKEWARWLAIILGIFSLFAFPIGTVIGALIIWYLLKADVRAAFELSDAEMLPEEPELVDPQEPA
ncbi:MAG: hypothetical protein AB8I56_12480 [Anaerolineales bacterium]